MQHPVSLQVITVVVIGNLSANMLGIGADVADTHAFKNKAEGF